MPRPCQSWVAGSRKAWDALRRGGRDVELRDRLQARAEGVSGWSTETGLLGATFCWAAGPPPRHPRSSRPSGVPFLLHHQILQQAGDLRGK